MNTFVDIADTKQRISISQVVQMCGLVLKSEGQHLRGNCPFCKKERTFRVTPGAGQDGLGMWGCFGCAKRGDSVALVAYLRDMKMPEAARVIRDHFGLDGARTVPNTSPSPPAKEKRKQPFDMERYLADLATDAEELAALGIEPDTLRAFKAGYCKVGGLRDMLALGVCNGRGELLGFVGRSIELEAPALKLPKGVGFTLEDIIFGADRVEAGPLYLATDPVHVLMAHDLGVTNVVSFLTERQTVQQLVDLTTLMEEKRCDTVGPY
jgi:DNA primase